MNTAERIAALCHPHPDRHVGGPGNRAANDLFAEHAAARGLSVERLGFEALEWMPGATGATLATETGETFSLHTGPFSASFDDGGPLTPVASVDELEALTDPGAILLMHGEIAADQITPRNYPFYLDERSARVLAALDRARPAAVIAATDRTLVAAAASPFPISEDGDFGYPSAYLHERDSGPLLAHAAETVRLRIDSHTRPVPSEQVVARLQGSTRGSRRVVVCAHIDSHYGTPGALDNATGVAALMALADLLGETPPALDVELVPFNGEDDYSAAGELAYLGQPRVALDQIALAVNIDDAGFRGEATAISFYGCPVWLRETALDVASRTSTVAEGPEWPMSDHMVFAMRGVPAMAITSNALYDVAQTIAHTDRDTPELVDPALVDETAAFVASVLRRLERSP